MTNKIIKTTVAFIATLQFNLSLAQVQPESMHPIPEGSYTAYFKYLDTTGNNMPANAVKAAKGVVGIEDFKYLPAGNGRGTGVLIRTNRADKRICLITVAHVLKNSLSVGKRIPLEIYFKYFGIDDNGRSKTISGIHTTIPDAELVAYQYGAVGDVFADYAILLIDRRHIPVKAISTAAYDLNHIPASTRRYYLLGHPYGMPMRIADNLSYTVSNAGRMNLMGTGNNTTGAGGSGGPLFVAITGASDAVVGLLRGSDEDIVKIPDNELVGNDKTQDIGYFRSVGCMRLGYFADEIRLFAQQSAVTAQSTSDCCQEAEEVDNTANWNAFGLNAFATNLDALTPLSSQEYAEEHQGTKLVRARSLTMNFEYQPSAATQNLVTYCLAAQTNLENGFQFMAPNTEFSIFSVVPEPAATVAGTSRKESSKARNDSVEDHTTVFAVYPNPSPDGMFNISLPATGQFRVAVHSLDGRKICEAVCAQKPFHLVLPAVARGNYVLHVYNAGNNTLVYKKLITY